MIQDNCFISTYTFDKRCHRGKEMSHMFLKDQKRPISEQCEYIPGKTMTGKLNRVPDQTYRQMNCSSKTRHIKMGFPSDVMSCEVLTKTFTAEWVASWGSLTAKQRE